jgi:hypothetical protein
LPGIGEAPWDHDAVTSIASACPVCGLTTATVEGLARHLVDRAEESDVAHVMWLNRNVTKHRTDAEHLATLLRRLAVGRPVGEGRVER